MWLPQVAVPVVGSLLAFFGVWVQTRKRRDALDFLDRSIEIRKKLRVDSQSGLLMDSYIERQIKELAETSNRQRNPSGMAIAIGCLVIAVGLAIPAVRYGHWWTWLWVAIAFFGLPGLYGLVHESRRTVRDAQGRPIESAAVESGASATDQPL